MDAIYARQSIDKKGSLSIEGQIELCRKFTVDDALVFRTRAFPAKHQAACFRRAHGGGGGGPRQKIVVYRLDRFSRSLADFSQIWELLRKNDVEFTVRQRAVRHFLTDGTGHAQHCDDLCPA